MPSHRSSHGSTSSRNAGPAWGPPRAPLPPHRLAMLANALGVSTPLPAMTLSGTALSPSAAHLGNSPSTSSVDLPWRPVTPSTASAPPSQSKYLLHVIPPVHLPHESEPSDSTELAPPPPNASGYHTQFRRGTLVALQSTLQAQLVIIAREYALPSTMGIVLYLITSSPQSQANSPVPCSSPDHGNANGLEPGPRLSEEIWKHIWTRALRAEREESLTLSRIGTSSPFGLGLTVETNGPSQPLRPLITPTRTEHAQPRPFAYPITPSSTSTASSVSDLRSHEKSTGASSSRSEPNTPDTSRSSDNGPPGIELPGLNSNSIIPILAKVEFDIDRRKATWYEPWMRSRRLKRAESRSSHHTGSPSRSRDEGNSADEKRLPFDLKLVERMKKPSFLRSQDELTNGEYAPLDGDEHPASRMTSGPDPLGDVFGTDAETWTEIHSESEGKGGKVNNPNVVELALDAMSLTDLPEQNREDDENDEVDEVRDIMRRMSRPPLNVSIPETDSKRRSSPTTAGGSKRPTPAPLVLTAKSPTNNLIAAVDTADFRDKEGLSLEIEQEYLRSRSPGEEKRVGTLFEDLDLGLDLGDDDEEYDENDPNDRRRSQYLMKAKLDELERTLAQFSPQQLKTAILSEDTTIMHRRNISSTSPPPDSGSGPTGSQAWPAVPYASMATASRPTNLPPSPPRLALNGVTTGAPKGFIPPALQLQGASSAESQMRRRELEQATYTTTMRPSHQTDIASDSPIPLSPDPFGRYPSVYDADTPPVQSYWDPASQQFTHEPPDPRPSVSSIDDGSLGLTTPSSRFSADSSSVVVDPSDKATKPTAPLVSVKSLKKLWRRSKPTAGAVTQPPTPATASFQMSGPPPPPTPTDQLINPFPSTRSVNGKSPVDLLHFDQESPYPLHPGRPSLSGSRPTSPAVLINAPPQEKTARKSILKSWKSMSSAAGAGSQQQVNGSDPRKHSERPVSNETIKPRRPSVLDGSIPPSPKLPEQYLPSNHARTGSAFFERRKPAGWSKMGPGQHHSSASQEIPQTPSSLVMQTPVSTSPSRSDSSATSRDSHPESIETSQFEVISSPKVASNLTYPYMTLDHDHE